MKSEVGVRRKIQDRKYKPGKDKVILPSLTQTESYRLSVDDKMRMTEATTKSKDTDTAFREKLLKSADSSTLGKTGVRIKKGQGNGGSKVSGRQRWKN